jgi:hypothetical protein
LFIHPFLFFLWSTVQIHPQTVIDGWRKAVAVAREALTANTRDNG